jgi:FkbM family methyltransferase
MNAAERVLYALRGAFLWDNPFELLLDCHVLRRWDPVRLIKSGAQLVVNYRSSDMSAAKDILLEGMYDNALEVSVSTIPRGACFRYLNLGANIGVFDIKAGEFSKRHGLGISGASLEMNTATFSRLILNLELNNLLHIRAINAALANEDGQALCELSARDTGQSVADFHTEKLDTAQMVVTLSWKSLWDKVSGAYDLVKVDIEGAERFWLEALTAQEARQFRHIVIETHSADLHGLCDERLTDLAFDLVEKQTTSDTTRLSLWKHGNPTGRVMPATP